MSNDTSCVCVCVATLDGGIGYILPIPEKVYRRLLMLQMKMNSGLPHWAGLNPKPYRMFQTHHQYLYNPQRNILDGNLLARYSQLSHKEKLDFTKQIGTNHKQVLDNLKEIDMITAHFWLCITSILSCSQLTFHYYHYHRHTQFKCSIWQKLIERLVDDTLPCV